MIDDEVKKKKKKNNEKKNINVIREWEWINLLEVVVWKLNWKYS